MKLVFLVVVLAVVFSAVECRPQEYEADSHEEFGGGQGVVGEDNGDRQGRTFGLVKKGIRHFRNRFFRPSYNSFGGGNAPCASNYPNYNQNNLNSGLPLTPFAL